VFLFPSQLARVRANLGLPVAMPTFPTEAQLVAAEAGDMMNLLATLPRGSKVAVAFMLGSFCPITLGHVQCFVEARKLLLGRESSVTRPRRLERFDACLGFVALNGDHHVAKKLREKGQQALARRDRAHLVRLATARFPWLSTSDESRSAHLLSGLQRRHRHLHFQLFVMNGADDVVKYKKWQKAGPNYRMITMGRPGDTERVRKGAAAAKVKGEHFLLGPELPDISSTKARDASRKNDQAKLLRLLHQAVADFLLRRDGHRGLRAWSSSSVSEVPRGVKRQRTTLG
jgi:nicotinic acid mononucleotide adenylyltransferase